MNKNGILLALSESDKTRFGKEDFSAQSVPQKVFSSIWAVESEVNNGGFSQYVLNQSSETAGFVGSSGPAAPGMTEGDRGFDARQSFEIFLAA